MSIATKKRKIEIDFSIETGKFTTSSVSLEDGLRQGDLLVTKENPYYRSTVIFCSPLNSDSAFPAYVLSAQRSDKNKISSTSFLILDHNNLKGVSSNRVSEGSELYSSLDTVLRRVGE